MICLLLKENFDAFYKDQVPYFKADANSLLSDLSDYEIAEIYNSLPAGQFTKGKTEYYNFVQSKIDEYILSQWKKKMQALWLEKTGTKDPVEWSEKYNTPFYAWFQRNSDRLLVEFSILLRVQIPLRMTQKLPLSL